jgi:hypothetical protein
VRRKIAVGTRRGLIWLALTLSAASACKDTAWTPSGSAEVVLSEIKLGGAANVAKRIDANESFGRSVMNGIETGDSAWLEVADKITPASGAAEASLAIALASALPRSPVRVLSLLGPKYPVEEICGIPFLKPEPAMITSYHDEAVAALGRVKSVPLTKVRDACVAALDRAREYRLERIDPAPPQIATVNLCNSLPCIALARPAQTSKGGRYSNKELF